MSQVTPTDELSNSVSKLVELNKQITEAREDIKVLTQAEKSLKLQVKKLMTDNGLDDGCMVALPGSHKSHIDLGWQDYEGLDTPGAVPILGQAGDVLIFSEALLHDGLFKRSEGMRVNLYYNYVHAHYNVMMREPSNAHHFYFPPQIRQRFTASQRALTRWMEYARWDY